VIAKDSAEFGPLPPSRRARRGGTAFAISPVFVVSQVEGVARMRRAVGDALVSAGALMILLLALMIVDGRVREQISLRFSAQPSAQLVSAGAQVRDLTSVVFEAARDQSLEHAPLMIFALAATVLVLFMLRT
jgi:hypothetical protein